MIGLLQRVRHARVEVQDKAIAEIDLGLLVLVGIQSTDDKSKAERLLERLLGYRVFADEQKKMNLSLIDINGGLLLVPQFTLVADTNKGMRPSFSNAATPEIAQSLFNHLLNCAKNSHSNVVSGVFGADMQISLTNDGPVTFQLNV
jgi:D-aminoacyl-tRNA deacylase